ncbi:cyclic AMP-responsive element-binding protein 3-like protein 3 [Platysternon megacephalum]|uniref:Cyclic AMP-responsive element-binding protein 3-like protein 3 n=1 Tax=Platysternon megacephalum TaxID=55544 RepID=A0A4D9DYU3_9SAUR|nr:cyclic AMP-responsive element-binding protein 3-like protein 3 [Platysternon megacephalum]
MSDSRAAPLLLPQQTSHKPMAGPGRESDGNQSAGQRDDPLAMRMVLERKDMPESEPAAPPPLPGKTQREIIPARRMSSSQLSLPEPPSPMQDAGAGSSAQRRAQGDLVYSNVGEMRAHLVPAKSCRGESPEKLPSEASGDPLPPPLPKKQLSRTRSLPEMQTRHYYPCKSAHFPTPHYVYNTLYEVSTHSRGGSRSYSESTEGLLCGPKRYLSKSQSLGESEPWDTLRKAHPVPVPRHITTEELTFTTPDGELVYFFKDLESTANVYEKVMGCHLVSLIHLTARVQEILGGKEEEQQLMGAELAGKKKWTDFTLLDKEPCCETGDAWYYRVSCASEQAQQIFAAKVHKSYPCSLSVQMSVGAHFNIQQVFGYFVDSLPKDLMPVERPQKLGQFCPGEHEEAVSTGASLPLNQVAISPEVPYQTLADFVKGSRDLHSSRPGHYERLACLLLLQLCTGLEHLKQQKVAHYNIHMENLLLVQCPSPHLGQQDKDPSAELSLPRLVISNFSKAIGTKTSTSMARDPDRVSMAPKWLSLAHFQNAEGFQVGLLVYEILHQPNPLEKPSGLRSGDLPAIPALSIYSWGLQNLATLLLHPDPRRSVPIEQAKNMLQVLLWGPRQELFARNQITLVLLRNWVAIKRVLLLLKFAEKVSEAEVTIRLEEWLCCLYFTETTEHTLLRTLRIMHASESPGAR